MTPLRLTLVTHYFPAHRGGVELVAWELASRLAASGTAQVTWWASNTDAPPPERPGLRCVPVAACNAIERHLGLPLPLWSPAALVRLVRSVRASDVVHLHDFLYPQNVLAWAAARLSRRPVVVTQHIGTIPYKNPLLRLLLGSANRLLGRLVLGSAAQTLFVSAAVREYFGGFVRFARPPLVAPNGVDARLFAFADEERRRVLRAALGVEPGTPLLLFVGRFVEKKGLPLLQRIARRLAHARWVFVGWGPLDPGRWGLANVSVRGSLTREELVPLYQAADLLVLPSVGEGFPLVVQEAMACGTPALVSAETARALPEAATVLFSETLEGDDPAARWAGRIAELAAAPQPPAARRAAVAQFARAHWSWERCVARYAEVLRTCAR